MALPPRGKPRGFRAMKIYDALRREYIDKYGSADLDYTPGQGSRDEEARDCLNIKKRDTVGRTGVLRSKASENPKPREIV